MSTPTPPTVRLLETAIRAGTVPGGIIAHGVDPEPVACGRVAPGGPPFPTDAILRIQSMTKVITAVATLRLIERGELALDAPVAGWLPELATPRVLPHPLAPLEAARPSATPITVEHLLTCTSGLGIATAEGPLQRAMADAGLEAGAAPWSLGADEWLAALGGLPLVGEPGTVWRYHHSFGVLGVLLSRLTGRPLGEHLRADLLDPLGMADTGSFVPAAQRHRLPPAFRIEDGGLVEVEPAAGGPLVGPPPHDVSHGELVSTAADYLRFLRALRNGELLSAEHLALLASDLVPAAAKQEDSFFPGFWDGTGWGCGVAVVTGGERQGSWGWSGGFGTDFFVAADGTIGLLLVQVEMGTELMGLIDEFQQLPAPRG